MPEHSSAGSPDQATLVTTRRALHQVAEHVVSAARKRASGQIGLRPLPGGFGTPPDEVGRVIAVDGVDLVVTGADEERRAPLTTVRAAAEVCGIEPGFPWTKTPPATALEPDRPLTVDVAAAALLANWFELGAAAMTALATELADEGPTDAQIYPEHFDLGMTVGQVNYGASPGDDAIPVPYLYVGPHDGPPAGDDYWNAPFGAARTHQEIRSVAGALDFFREGHRRLSR